MNYLLPGNEPESRLNILIGLTKISSEPTIKALKSHFVVGLSEESAAGIYEVSTSNFNRAKKRLEHVAQQLEKLKEHDWPHYQEAVKLYKSIKETIS